MAKKDNKLLVYTILAVGILLVGSGWLLFHFLSTSGFDDGSDQDFKKAARIKRIKTLSEENLRFFPIGDSQQDILTKLQNNPQYDELDLEIDTFIDLYNPGNPYPFKVPESSED